MINKLFLSITIFGALSLSQGALAQVEQNGVNEVNPNQTTPVQSTTQTQTPDVGVKCDCPKAKLISSLNLTDEQKAKIKQIKEQARANMQENMQAMKDICQKMNTLIQSEKLDTQELDKLVNQKTALMAAKIKNKVMVKNQIYNILTPEQKAKFAEILQQKSQRFQEFLNKMNTGNNNNLDDHDDDDDLNDDLD